MNTVSGTARPELGKYSPPYNDGAATFMPTICQRLADAHAEQALR